ncbi:hypothetical protein ACD591_09965 [Rufibacter glacialis]|uniref:Uncharacterized protein n=1 Tax=Rufibacter glacialis TaxID=1259555 RepID=A0A5M8QAC7_9BACT|nr:hypothetical protein [Rufibacter glacialis]KAA6431904.1 hypothetical protein FOE74_17505 [Rufibacter glacialis]GGK80545.1 hypothetical protein GCM10011405_30390 [Rufibacter glacialis]
MKEKFLKAKHWQLFILTCGIPVVFQLGIMEVILSKIGSGGDSDPSAVFTYLKLSLVVVVLFAAIFFGWFWSVAIGLQGGVPKNVKMKVRKFKVFFFMPLAYILLISITMGGAVDGMVGGGTGPSEGLIGGFIGIIVPLHLFSMFCIFYCLYFVAKTYKTVELQREVGFWDFSGEFFQFWFFPIGIWSLQPKINRMAEGTGTAPDNWF